MLTLSILGLYRQSPTLFDELQLPEGVDRDTLIDGLLTDTAELEVLYPDPGFFRFVLGVYSRRRAKSWQKWQDTTTLEYNPIENYDRIETWTDTGESSSTGTSESYGDSNNTESVWAYDTGLDEPAPRGKTSASDTASASTTGTGRFNNTKEGRIHGNIGVTTAQQMIEEERRITDQDIYHYIINDIARHFTVGVW